MVKSWNHSYKQALIYHYLLAKCWSLSYKQSLIYYYLLAKFWSLSFKQPLIYCYILAEFWRVPQTFSNLLLPFGRILKPFLYAVFNLLLFIGHIFFSLSYKQSKVLILLSFICQILKPFLQAAIDLLVSIGHVWSLSIAVFVLLLHTDWILTSTGQIFWAFHI